MLREVLITGAHGFIGRHAARRYAQSGWRVTGIGHGNWPPEEWRIWGLAEWHPADVTVDTLLACGREPAVIIHCAGSGSVGYSLAHPCQDFERTTLTTLAVLEYARLYAREARIVLSSSAAVYGRLSTLPIAENAPLAPASPYGVHKRLAEELSLSYAMHFGVLVAIVRFFSVYGPGLRKQLLWDACRKLGAGKPEFAGTGEERRDWLHVADAVELLWQVADHASRRCPIVNGGTGSAVAVREVLQRIAAAFPAAAPISFTGLSRPGDPAHYEADTRSALALGWRPVVGLDEGIAEYVSWFSAGTT